MVFLKRIVVFLIFVFYSQLSCATYHKIIFFGDSLSDNGNLYSFLLKIIPKSPPYYEGRFTNNEIWTNLTANYFKEKYGITSDNYAVGGEVISWHLGGFLPWSFYQSVTNYFFHTSSREYSDTLYVIWLGANDYLDGAPDVENYTDKAIYNLNYSIERLINSGGKNFLILNLPDLSKIPYSKINGNTANIEKLTRLHNAKLQKLIRSLREKYKNIQVELYKMNELFDEFVSVPDINVTNKKYHMHIREIEKFCWEGGYTLHKKTNVVPAVPYTVLTLINSSPALKEAYSISQKAALGMVPCEDADDYIFWDKVHPTAVMHDLIAKKVTEYIELKFKP